MIDKINNVRVLLLIFVFCFINKCQSQSIQNSGRIFIFNRKIPDVKGTIANISFPKFKWNEDSLYSVCNLKQFCLMPWEHYILIGKILKEPDGWPVYGLQNALIGYITKYGFAATFHRDHLKGKELDLELLENPDKMKLYLIKIGVKN